MTALCTPERVPTSAVERLRANMNELVQHLADAVQTAALMGSVPARAERLLTLLQQEQSRVQTGAQRFAEGDREPLFQTTSELTLLVRRMDGYDFSFAGEAAAEQLSRDRQLLVLVAWQITAAASGSDAAGL